MYQQAQPEQTIIQKAMERFVWLLNDSHFEYAEFQNAAVGIFWGAWLLNPHWQTFASSKSFDAMSHWAPEEVWGVAILLLGLLQMGAFIREHRHLRMAGTLSGVFVWFSIGIAFGLVNIASTGVVVYPLLGLGAGWSFWRLLVSDDR